MAEGFTSYAAMELANNNDDVDNYIVKSEDGSEFKFRTAYNDLVKSYMDRKDKNGFVETDTETPLMKTFVFVQRSRNGIPINQLNDFKVDRRFTDGEESNFNDEELRVYNHQLQYDAIPPDAGCWKSTEDSSKLPDNLPIDDPYLKYKMLGGYYSSNSAKILDVMTSEI